MSENSQGTLQFCSMYSKQQNGTERWTGNTTTKVHTVFSRPKRNNTVPFRKKKSQQWEEELPHSSGFGCSIPEKGCSDMSAVKHFCYGIVTRFIIAKAILWCPLCRVSTWQNLLIPWANIYSKLIIFLNETPAHAPDLKAPSSTSLLFL